MWPVLWGAWGPQVISGLEGEALGLKRQLGERDEALAERDRAIQDLRRKGAEAEKARCFCVLMHRALARRQAHILSNADLWYLWKGDGGSRVMAASACVHMWQGADVSGDYFHE